MQRLFVIKIGGEIVDMPSRLATVLQTFSRISGPRILVHGGGRMVNDLARRLGIPVVMKGGRRVTDGETLQLTAMVYAGLINKTVVAKLQSLGTPAVGLSGADGGVIRAVKRPGTPVDYGFAGDVTGINTDFLSLLIAGGQVPVLCALTADADGQLLNTNADTIAAETAIALRQFYRVELHFLGDLPGLLADVNDATSVIGQIDPAGYDRLKEAGAVTDGMLPKMENAFRAVRSGVDGVYLTHFSRLPDHTSGTRVVRGGKGIRDEG